MEYLVASLLLLFGAACIVLTALQLPGAWLLLGAAILIEWGDALYTDAGTWTFSWPLLLACAIIAGIGELIEFLAAVFGAQRGGASRRGIIGALIGCVAGMLVLTPLFFFVPLLGSLLGALLGTFLGAVIGELTADGTTLRETMRPALGAAVGRVVGTVGKIGVTAAMWLALTVAAFWP